MKILFAFLLMCSAQVLHAYDFEVDAIYYNFNEEGESVEVTSGSYGGYSGDIVIPSTVTYEGKTYSVTSIGDWAFEDCSSLTSIEIPNSVTSIGDYAFYYCFSLTSVIIGNSVISIGEHAFGWCSSLTSIIVADDNPFYDSREACNAIIETASNTLIAGCQNTVIPNSVTSIGDGAFFFCSFLTIEIPNSVTDIGNQAFWGCSSLTSVIIGNSVTSIGEYAFSGCSSLTSIKIPDSVISIGNRVFSDCSSLTSITVEDGNPIFDSREACNAIIETASNTLIAGCQNTVIPNSVTNIGENAFCWCSSLTSVAIPNSVTSIGWGAFIGCSSLTTIICYAEEVPKLDFDVFFDVPQNEATLYVPASALETYKVADQWKDFGTILPIDEEATGITSTIAEQETDATYYTLGGVSVKNPTKKGIYIKNGKKMYIQ